MRRATVTLAVVLAALTACTGHPSVDPTAAVPSPAPSTASAPPTTPDATAVRSDGTPATSGDVTVHIWVPGGSGPGAGTEGLEDDAVRVTVPAPAPGSAEVTIAYLAPPEGAVLEPQTDGSLVVRGDDGAFLAGMSAPVPTGGTARPRVEAGTDGLVTWLFSGDPARQDDPGTATDGTLHADLATRAVRSATWMTRDDEGGRSLAVVPTTWARTPNLAADVGVWSQLIALEPEADTRTMHDQLTCHTIGAPNKESWNLEPWRPEVGLLETMAARCNPE